MNNLYVNKLFNTKCCTK